MVIRDLCPRCKSPEYKKKGHIHNGKQTHQYHDCGRQFVDCFEPYLVSDETRGLIEHLLLERLSCGAVVGPLASRWVRQTLSLSKKLDHHIGTITYFICNYNLLKARA